MLLRLKHVTVYLCCAVVAIVLAGAVFVLLRRRRAHPEAVLVTESPKPPTPLTPASGTSTSMQALSLPSSGRPPSASLLQSPSAVTTPCAPAHCTHSDIASSSTAASLSAELAFTTPTSGTSQVSSAAAPPAAPRHRHGNVHPPHLSSAESSLSSGGTPSFMPDNRHTFRRSQVQMVNRPQSGRSTAVSPAAAQHGSVPHGLPTHATQPWSGSSSGSARSLFQAAVANMQVRSPDMKGCSPLHYFHMCVCIRAYASCRWCDCSGPFGGAGVFRPSAGIVCGAWSLATGPLQVCRPIGTAVQPHAASACPSQLVYPYLPACRATNGQSVSSLCAACHFCPLLCGAACGHPRMGRFPQVCRSYLRVCSDAAARSGVGWVACDLLCPGALLCGAPWKRAAAMSMPSSFLMHAMCGAGYHAGRAARHGPPPLQHPRRGRLWHCLSRYDSASSCEIALPALVGLD